MAKLRVTRELLEYALDLPEGLTLTGITGPITLTDGVEVVELEVIGASVGVAEDGSYALGYTETEIGATLTEIVPV